MKIIRDIADYVKRDKVGVGCCVICLVLLVLWFRFFIHVLVTVVGRFV